MKTWGGKLPLLSEVKPFLPFGSDSGLCDKKEENISNPVLLLNQNQKSVYCQVGFCLQGIRFKYFGA